MSYLFYGCSSLESVTFTNFSFKFVNNMSYMFFNCNKIKSINLPNITFEKMINRGEKNGIMGMISNCSSLISIDLSNYNNQNIDLSSILEDNKGHSNLIFISIYIILNYR